MKFILLTVLSAIIFFFVWNILKRLFFSQFYKNPNHERFEKSQKSETKIGQKVNWDDETVDYEEVKETKDTKN